MTHAAHAVSHTAHSTRVVEPRMSRSEARSVIDSSCRSHSTTVATADVSSASPMNATALTMDRLIVLRMRLRLT
jgi:hypothetical protein